MKNLLSYQTEESENGTKVSFRGPIAGNDAQVFQELEQLNSKKVIFDFENIEYVNSLGIREWVTFLNGFEQDRLILFENCTLDIIMQININSRFRGHAKIISFFGDFACSSCQHESSKLFEVANGFEELVSKFQQSPCPSCGKTMTSEVPETTYLSFLRV